ncbi:hypothetical protein VspSTUT11_02030 [Vibrio sp. STUT-A11]|nr:hypothetical protein VspSTUT11_02030 [Vibrio sp. STUT-A11]
MKADLKVGFFVSDTFVQWNASVVEQASQCGNLLPSLSGEGQKLSKAQGRFADNLIKQNRSFGDLLFLRHLEEYVYEVTNSGCFTVTDAGDGCITGERL